MKFVSPKTDIAFKKIFGNDQHKEILIEFLNEVLDLAYSIIDITILNPYQAPKLAGLKESTLDIKAKDEKGHEFIVEMQVEKDLGFQKRVVYYSSKAYTQQLDKGQAYHKLKPVIFLGILDFSIFEHESHFSRHLILNLENQSHDLKDLEFNFIELLKFTKTESELNSISDKWIYFIKNADDFDHIPEHANTAALKHAYQIATQHTWTKEELDVYDYQGMRDYISWGAIEQAKIEGEEKGKLAGSVGILQRQLQKRFGELSNEKLQQLKTANAEQIEQWADKIFEVDKIEDLFSL
jgi:predicted transposase/invertase (TIGR01784 family)